MSLEWIATYMFSLAAQLPPEPESPFPPPRSGDDSAGSGRVRRKREIRGGINRAVRTVQIASGELCLYAKTCSVERKRGLVGVDGLLSKPSGEAASLFWKSFSPACAR